MKSVLSEKLLEFLTTNQDKEISQDFSSAASGGYEEFVTKLKNWAGDPKVTEFLKSGLSDGVTSDEKFSVSKTSISCSQLIPTQNEIDLNKSLDFFLKDPPTISLCLSGKDVVLGGKPIITFNNRYIIDGHHRWSEVYCINPNAKMVVINFKHSGLSPEDMLKATQVAIAATSGSISVNTVDGHNLLKMDPMQVMRYVFEKISDECVKAFGKDRKYASKRIALNVQTMQKNNKPIKNAPARGFMPQTDGDLQGVVNVLSKGIGQSVEPFTKQSNLESKQMNKKILREFDPSKSSSPSAPFNQSDYDNLRNELAILALKDKSLGVSYDSLPTIKDSELEMWLEIADPGNKIWKKYEGAIVPKKGKFTDSNMREDDYEGYDRVMAPLIFTYYKLAIHKAKKDFGAMEDDTHTAIAQQKQQLGTMSEAMRRMLKEEESVEQADPVTMFQDFSDISGSLADIYSTLVGYQTSYVSNPKIQQAIGTIMTGVNQLMKQSTAAMQMLGASFGLNEAQIKEFSKKKINESVDFNNIEKWTKTEWAAFENLSAMQKMEVVNKSDYFKQLKGPRAIQQIIAGAKKWAKAGGYKNWERVATTPAGKRSIIYQFVKQIPTVSRFQMTELIGVLDEIVKYWR